MKEASSLLEKYRQGACTEEELLLLHSWFHELNNEEPNTLSQDDLIAARQSFDAAVKRKAKALIPWRKLVSAAAALFLVGFVAYYLMHALYFNPLQGSKEQEAVLLILDDGREINLTDAENGSIEKELGLTVQKTASGKLRYRYDGDGKGNAMEVRYHTLQTPVGQTYEIVLDDGSTIFLNAQSKMRFPTSFAGLKSREIELSGEAYFEVTKRFQDHDNTVRMPFVVHSKGQEVEVLGTAFNINAYADEETMKTTLAHGIVRVHVAQSSHAVVLSEPGDQAVVQGGQIHKQQVLMGNELAWKRGKIILQDQDIYSVMRAIGRWYPIDVVYKDNFKDALFGGVISKDKSLEEILKLVEATGEVQFQVASPQGDSKERRVTVMK